LLCIRDFTSITKHEQEIGYHFSNFAVLYQLIDLKKVFFIICRTLF